VRLLVDSGNYFTRIGNDELRVIKDSSEIEAFSEEEKIEVVVSPPQFERILEISGSDMLAVVDGGVKVSEFVEAIRKEGLYFPAGTLLFDNITMAQMIDDGFVSDLESGFGRLREYILSLEIVTSAGEVISSGSRSVKDVTGYNITGFVYGAMGRCGLVTKVVTKLIPIYEHKRMAAYGGNANVLERLSSRINFGVGSVCQTIYYAGSLTHIY
jgi:glycolate oxidase